MRSPILSYELMANLFNLRKDVGILKFIRVCLNPSCYTAESSEREVLCIPMDYKALRFTKLGLSIFVHMADAADLHRIE